MSVAQLTSYDEVPYESHPFAQTHPDRLATVATLLGTRPPIVERCRVLELGCAAGGNIIPMALGLPESTFIGIDLSSRQIADGLKIIDALQLKNIELKHQSILEVDAALGRFDYVICHGVYSWVPSEVREKILDICSKNLTPNGVAYVSYNTYPGWHMRAMIRDMMCYHARQFAEPKARVQQARNLLDFLAKSVASANNPFSAMLQSELQMLRQSRDSYLFHEHLEDVNDPVYFHQFAERAEAHGLQYLGETDLRVMMPGQFPPEVQNVLQMLSTDVIHLEQYMDFLRNRTFRQTLLCHQSVARSFNPRPERLASLQVSSPAKPLSPQPDLQSSEYEKFQGPEGTTMSVRQPLAKAAMRQLSEAWPHPVSFTALRDASRARLNTLSAATDATSVAQDNEVLWQALLSAYASPAEQMVELQLSAPRFVSALSERPLASPLARLQAQTSARVTNMRHESVVLDDFACHLLRQLDGTRDRTELANAMSELVRNGALQAELDGQTVQDSEKIQAAVSRGVEHHLAKLLERGLLIG